MMGIFNSMGRVFIVLFGLLVGVGLITLFIMNSQSQLMERSNLLFRS